MCPFIFYIVEVQNDTAKLLRYRRIRIVHLCNDAKIESVIMHVDLTKLVHLILVKGSRVALNSWVGHRDEIRGAHDQVSDDQGLNGQ